LSIFADIFVTVILPILLMVAVGAVSRRRFGIDLNTLGKLNLHVLTPAFIFDRVVHAHIGWDEMGGIVAFTAAQVAILGAIVFTLGKAFGATRQTLAVVATTVMFYNSGNIGIPLAELAFPDRGAAPQVFVVLTQNVLCFTVGLAISAAAQSTSKRHLAKKLLSLPVLYTFSIALLVRAWLGTSEQNHLPAFIEKTVGYLAGALVPVALILLGAQLASRPRWPRWKPLAGVLGLRLFISPAIMAGMLWGMHLAFPGSMFDLWPWPAMVMIFTAAVPSAVNTMILTMEMGGDTDLAADCVFWTTLASSVTLVLTLAVVRGTMG
jgi:malate permease and related proteins